MGAIISLPVTAAASFFASFFGSLSSTVLVSSFKSLSGGSSSLATRLNYAALLLVNSLVSWFSLSSNYSFLWSNKTCTSTGECGFFTVHRLNFSLGMLHLLLSSMLVNVKSTTDRRASLQNSWWLLKLLVFVLLVVLSFTIPNRFFVFFSKWVSVPSGSLFILIGLVLLVDFAHEWAERCIQHVEMEDENSSKWQKFLIIGTSLMYIGALGMTVAMYVIFARDNCTMNQVSVTVNLLLSIITTGLSVHPKVQEYNPKCGLAQSSMVAIYGTYLTMSALASEPDDKQCNPFVRSDKTRKLSVVLGSLFTFVAIAYTTTRAAANSAFNSNDQHIFLDGDDDIEYEGVSQTRNQLRSEAIRQAVDEGALPESALHDTAWANNSAGESGDDERIATRYNYSLFHIIFFLATQWIAILLTVNVTKDDVGDFIPVGRTYFYSWVKIVSAWICYGLYGWTLVAPMVLPDRFGYDAYE
ncbi:LANO_0C06062g1_1 [Lachancea nothofagi CBS 11611]|uniref:LANO_0C06062g1_1 n=1 Tax=Lachancea nothofagi CBS 11611 TaxID=1266666 RepID=A0A1G4J7N5_9SACH|nr:LANO_0C06062g1_1 [Lachancea nothofagi CBS 11611]